MSALVIITCVSLAIAAVASVVAWRALRNERLRSDARIAALAADIHGDVSSPPSIATFTMDQVDAPVEMFGSALAQPREFPLSAAVIGAAAVIVGIALVVALAGRQHPAVGRTDSGASQAQGRSTAVAGSAPLELISLRHEREGNRLTVHGLIRNPSAGNALNHVTAVVLLFDANGGFITSGEAEISPGTLTPGEEAPFAVAVTNVGDVGRYRVSFRTGTRVVQHVDRRT
jgi:hypothetical protein